HHDLVAVVGRQRAIPLVDARCAERDLELLAGSDHVGAHGLVHHVFVLDPDRVADAEGEAAGHQVHLFAGGEPLGGACGDDQLVGVLVAAPAGGQQQRKGGEEQAGGSHGPVARTSAVTTSSPTFSNVNVSSTVEPSSRGDARSSSMMW